MNIAETRPYRMTRRAVSTQQTRDAILEAAIRLFWEEPARDLTLERIAGAAGVTVQTIIRHFGGRDGVFEAAVQRDMARVAVERDPSTISTLSDAVRQLMAHYERTGDRVIRLLAEEHRSATVAGLAARGRAWHRSWCDTVFADVLDRLHGPDRGRRLAEIVAVCDVYTWKLLRRDGGLDRASTELALHELLSALLEVD